MEKKYPPRLYAYETIAGDWWATEKRQFGDHNIKADFEKLLPLITIEEHEAIVQNLVEALEFTIHATEYLYNIKKDLPKGLDPTFYHTLSYDGDMELRNKAIKARSALENYKKQTGKNND